MLPFAPTFSQKRKPAALCSGVNTIQGLLSEQGVTPEMQAVPTIEAR
jgi:hypothetical protein